MFNRLFCTEFCIAFHSTTSILLTLSMLVPEKTMPQALKVKVMNLMFSVHVHLQLVHVTKGISTVCEECCPERNGCGNSSPWYRGHLENGDLP